MALTPQQFEVLLKPLHPSRVAQRTGAGKRLSYLEAWDVKAHLTRIFGFCGWSGEVVRSTIAFEEAPNPEAKTRNWSVGYMVTYQLTIHDQNGHDLATYTESAVGSSQLPSRGEAHDMAIKTAESDALKRAAIALGDQFGLSLYDNGSTNAVVKFTLVGPHTVDEQGPTQDSIDTSGIAPDLSQQPAIRDLDEPAESDDIAEAIKALNELRDEHDSEYRILAVAQIKSAYSDILDYVPRGREMTIGRYADLVAGGRYLVDGNIAEAIAEGEGEVL